MRRLKFKWDQPVKCRRYHGTLSASVCLIRHRTKNIAGCQDCPSGAQVELIFGERFDKDIAEDPRVVNRTANKLRRLFFRS